MIADRAISLWKVLLRTNEDVLKYALSYLVVSSYKEGLGKLSNPFYISLNPFDKARDYYPTISQGIDDLVTQEELKNYIINSMLLGYQEGWEEKNLNSLL